MQFVFVGNNLALDFCNTQVAERKKVRDLLLTWSDFYHWAELAELPVEQQPDVEFERVLALRADMTQLIADKAEGHVSASPKLDLLNDYLGIAHDLQHLDFNAASGEFILQPRHRLLPVSAVLAKIAEAAAQALVAEQRYPVKKCANPDCVLHFLDTSRTGKRKWCSMDICGNRTKVAVHQRKHS
ncbi:CGNR zinc finger domain-containing protein [Neptunicella sp. SCSIO 80796]|uniref:CGNR zinc finger domain-containing protein n=1 Tax=Neptunicella plasticusilytica TaxID=3117012 RepID=UPI003A4D4D37